ncbi:MAG: hypothetical protein GX080_05555 [Tissierellia bacterium]|nr:hypothetical protein [Tissierellia bacterium]
MKLVCPLCNGLYPVEFNCEKCNSLMEDQGAKVNFYDDYSPYLLDEITSRADGVSSEKCIHIFLCPNCGYKNDYVIERKEI